MTSAVAPDRLVRGGQRESPALRLALFTDTYPPQINGVSRTLERLANAVRDRGGEARVYTTTDPQTSAFDPLVWRRASVPFWAYPQLRLAAPVRGAAYRDLRAWRPTLIHSATPFGMGLAGRASARTLDVPMVTSYHTSFSEYAKFYRLGALSALGWAFFRWFHNSGARTYVPTHASAQQPLQVVIALHGMGGEGKGFAAPLILEAERNNWLLVAPTFQYGNWHDPEHVAQEDIDISQRLIATIDALPDQTHLKLKAQVHVIGFSRGAQLAHRFALFFPDHVDRVVAFSAGTYTLPFGAKDIDGDGVPDIIVLPYGTADFNKRLGHPINPIRLKQVHFFIGVGGMDNAAGDVPRQWDAYEGKTRLERALEFADALKSRGVHCTVQVFPGVGHDFTNAMLARAVQFLTSSDALLN